MLLLRVTDGHSKASALELTPHPRLSTDTAPGTKLLFSQQSIPLENGFIIVSPDHVENLGGVVPDLFEQWKLMRDMRAAGARLDKAGLRTGRPVFHPFSPVSTHTCASRNRKRYDVCVRVCV